MPARRAIPGPAALPLVGGLFQLGTAPLRRMVELRAEHGGLVRLGPLGRRDVVLVTDPVAVRRVLLDNYRNYRKGLNAHRLRPILGDGSLLLEGEPWRQRRRLSQPAFHRQKIAALGDRFVDAADAAIEQWLLRPRGGSIDARVEMLKLTMGLTLRNMFDAPPDAIEELAGAWQVLYGELSQPRTFPRPRWVPDRRRDEILSARARIAAILDRLVAAADPASSTVAAMLKTAADDETGARLTPVELRDELITIFVGGYETSSNALAFTLGMLAERDDLRARLEAEIDQVLGSRAPTVADLARLPFNRAVLSESMRRFPPSFMITREAIAADTLGDAAIAAGDQLLVGIYALHHAPELWGDPDEFRPERFLPDRPEPVRFSYLPFGGGPRICLGEAYALTEIQLIIARLVQRLHIRRWGTAPVEAVAGIGLRPRYPIRLAVSPRNRPNQDIRP